MDRARVQQIIDRDLASTSQGIAATGRNAYIASYHRQRYLDTIVSLRRMGGFERLQYARMIEGLLLEADYLFYNKTNMENTVKTHQFKLPAGTMINIGDLPVTLKEDTVIISATDFLDLPRDFMPQYEFTRGPEDEQGLVEMRKA